jgi:hypothetical protein
MTTFNVSNTAGFQSALSQAKAGDSILLAAGTYSGVGIYSKNVAGGAVTIASQDIGNPAVFTNFTIQSSSGLSFSHVVLSTVGSSDPYYAFRVYESQNISYDSVSVQGPTSYAGGGPDGFLFQHDNGVSITNTTFAYLADGMNETQDSNMLISGNYFHDIESDGIDSTLDTNVTIVGNTFTSFHPISGDHPDAIQFFEASLGPSSNVVVSNNTYVRGSGPPVQGITFGEEMGLPYNNVTISGNHVFGGLSNGIAFGGGGSGGSATGVSITNNVVVGYADQYSALYMDSTVGATLSGNTAQLFNLMSTVSGLNQGSNTTVPAVSAVTPPSLANASAVPSSNMGAAVVIAPNLTLIDPASVSVASAQVTISSGFLTGDALNFTNQNGITGSYNAATGVLTLTGVASQNAYEAALASITFSSSAISQTDLARTVSFQVNDGAHTSNNLSASVSVTPSPITPGAAVTPNFIEHLLLQAPSGSAAAGAAVTPSFTEHLSAQATTATVQPQAVTPAAATTSTAVSTPAAAIGNALTLSSADLGHILQAVQSFNAQSAGFIFAQVSTALHGVAAAAAPSTADVALDHISLFGSSAAPAAPVLSSAQVASFQSNPALADTVMHLLGGHDPTHVGVSLI